MKGYIQDPSSVLDYSIDWTNYLKADVIVASSWVIESPLTMVANAESFTDTYTTILLQGGVA